jgi:hypothetical protein
MRSPPYPSAINESDDRIHYLMALYGLRERLAAALDSGVSLAETGDDEVRAARDTTLETQVRGLARWETEHFGDDKPKLGMDFSVGGSFGFIPIMTLVSVRDPQTGLLVGGDDTPTPFSTYFQGFTWDVAGRAHFAARGRLEPGVFLKFGHGLLLSDTDSFDRAGGAAGAKSTVVLQRLRNGTGRVSPFWEAGFEGRLYGEESMDQIHSEKTYLNPALHLATGYRHDSRFEQWGQLSDTNPHRMFLRMAVSFNRFVNRVIEGEKPNVFSFQFGVDYDRSLSKNVPSSVRFFFGPDANLIKMLKPDK